MPPPPLGTPAAHAQRSHTQCRRHVGLSMCAWLSACRHPCAAGRARLAAGLRARAGQLCGGRRVRRDPDHADAVPSVLRAVVPGCAWPWSPCTYVGPSSGLDEVSSYSSDSVELDADLCQWQYGTKRSVLLNSDTPMLSQAIFRMPPSLCGAAWPSVCCLRNLEGWSRRRPLDIVAWHPSRLHTSAGQRCLRHAAALAMKQISTSGIHAQMGRA